MGFNQIKRINILGLDEPWSAGPKGWRTKEEGSKGRGRQTGIYTPELDVIKIRLVLMSSKPQSNDHLSPSVLQREPQEKERGGVS